MSGWNTGSSKDSWFLGLLHDPKKLAITCTGLGAVLLTAWVLTFREHAEDDGAQKVAFSLPDAARSLPPPVDPAGIKVAKPDSPAKPAGGREGDSLKALMAEAEKDAAGAPDETKAADGAAAQAEDEAGAPGKPVATEVGGFSGGGGRSSGSMGDFKGFGGGSPSAGGGATLSAAAPGGGAKPAANAVPAGSDRRLSGAVGASRALSAGRAMRQGSAGTHGAAEGLGVGNGAAHFGPGGATGSAFTATGGVGAGGNAIGGAGGAAGGAGAGFKGEGGGGGGVQGGGGAPPPGGGGPTPTNPPTAPPTAVQQFTRAAVKTDADAALAKANAYRTNVEAKIIAQEKPPLTSVSQRAARANAVLKAAQRAIAADLPKTNAKTNKTTASRFADWPAIVDHLTQAQKDIADVGAAVASGAGTLSASVKTLAKEPAQCPGKAILAPRGDDGVDNDAAGVLQAHRDAVSALKRLGAADVALAAPDALRESFDKQSGQDEAAISAAAAAEADPKTAKRYKALAAAYKAMAKRVHNDLKQADALLQPTYPPKPPDPAKKKGAAKKQATAALKALDKKWKKQTDASNAKAGDISALHKTLKDHQPAYPETVWGDPAHTEPGHLEDSVWRADEAAAGVNAPDPGTGQPLWSQSSELPALVHAGELSSEAFMELCDTHLGLVKVQNAAKVK